MKALILFDLHYEYGNPISQRKLERITSVEEDIDCLILGGDNAEISPSIGNHRILFEGLRKRFDCPAAFVVGNHDVWGRSINVSSKKLIDDVFPRIGREYGFTSLEQENLDVEETSFVGTYGHFDYSFLREGKGVSIEDLLRGWIIHGDKKTTWHDKKYMDWEGRTDQEVCTELVDQFGERLKTANGKVISLSHTIPRPSLNGWPDSKMQYFIEPYAGANCIGDMIEKHGGEYHFCGHTHIMANDVIGRTNVVNVGSDYKILRYLILETDNGAYNIEQREIVLGR